MNGLSAAALFLISSCAAACAQTAAPRADWDFKFRDFVIGAWWGPGATDAQMKLYRECGFNVVMCGRYMQLDDYADPNKGLRELDLAHKYGLGVLFDTYTKNHRPWGGIAGPTDDHPVHHPASLPELEWLYKKLGKHPALVGFMIGDDQGSVSQRAADCTRFLHTLPKPHLFPWLCGWISPDDLARHDNPIENPQIYPTLYSWRLPARELARRYAGSYAAYSRQCRDHGLIFWPMFNVQPPNAQEVVSDSLLRFPAYAALAYGAEGIWYFCYNGGSLARQGDWTTEAAARRALTPLYAVAREANRRILPWGRRVLGRRSEGVFGTAFQRATDWPFPADLEGQASPEGLAAPAKGKLIEAMDPDLLAGVLTREGEAPLVMVVDCRVSKKTGDLPPRTALIRFNRAVTGIDVLDGARARHEAGAVVRIRLQAGGGQMLQVYGDGIDALCSEEAIRDAPEPAAPRTRRVTEPDLAGIRAARIRIDVFGSDSRPEYVAKTIELNGRSLGRVPSNDADEWTPAVITLTQEQLAWIGPRNRVTVRTACADAWKFRNLTLAVQLADGAWVKSSADPQVHSPAGWAYSEGVPWGKDGAAGPIELALVGDLTATPPYAAARPRRRRDAALPGAVSSYHGYERHDLQVDGCAAIVVEPRDAAPGNPWIWRAEFFDHRPELDLALLARGWRLAFIDVGNTFGAPSAMKRWDAFYALLTGTYRLSKRPVLEGLSRGGLYVYNWAAAHPDRVGVIYGDNPVCDFKSWPGGKGKGPGSPDDWKKLIRDYGFASEQEALAYRRNPIDNLAPLARAHVPIIHCAADADEVAPHEENTAILEQRYRSLGGTIQVIVKHGYGHHPHGLDDPTPLVEFIERYTGRAGGRSA